MSRLQEELTFTQFETMCARYPDRAAVVYLGEAFSFARLSDLINRFATSLDRLGVHQGDKVMLYVANSAQWVFHAIVMLILLRWMLGGFSGSGLAGAALKAGVASATMGLVVAGAWFWAESLAQGTLSLGLSLGGVCILGAAIYGGLLFLLRVPELGLIWRMASDRLRRPS